jgi:hypothetical protein
MSICPARCAPQAQSFNTKITKDTKTTKRPRELCGRDRQDPLALFVCLVVLVFEPALTRQRGSKARATLVRPASRATFSHKGREPQRVGTGLSPR